MDSDCDATGKLARRRANMATCGAVVALVAVALVSQLVGGLNPLLPPLVSTLTTSDVDDSVVPADPARAACEHVASGVGQIRQTINSRDTLRSGPAVPLPGIVRSPPF